MESSCYKLLFFALIGVSLTATICCLIAILISFQDFENSSSSSLLSSQSTNCISSNNSFSCLQSYINIKASLNYSANPCKSFYSHACSKPRKSNTLENRELIKFSQEILDYLNNKRHITANQKHLKTILQSCFKIYRHNLIDQLFSVAEHKFADIVLDQAATLRSELLSQIPWVSQTFVEPKYRWIETPFFRVRKNFLLKSTFELDLISETDYFVKSINFAISDNFIEKALNFQYSHGDSKPFPRHEKPSKVLKEYLERFNWYQSRLLSSNDHISTTKNLHDLSISGFQFMELKNFIGNIFGKQPRNAQIQMTRMLENYIRDILYLHLSSTDYTRYLFEYYWTFNKAAELIYPEFEAFLLDLISQNEEIYHNQFTTWCLDNVLSVREFQLEVLFEYISEKRNAEVGKIWPVLKVIQETVLKNAEFLVSKTHSTSGTEKRSEFQRMIVNGANSFNSSQSEKLLKDFHNYYNLSSPKNYNSPISLSEPSKDLWSLFSSHLHISDSQTKNCYYHYCLDQFPIKIAALFSSERSLFWINYIENLSENYLLFLMQSERNWQNDLSLIEELKHEQLADCVSKVISMTSFGEKIHEYEHMQNIYEMFTNFVSTQTIQELNHLTEPAVFFTSIEYYYVNRARQHCSAKSRGFISKKLVDQILPKSYGFGRTFKCNQNHDFNDCE